MKVLIIVVLGLFSVSFGQMISVSGDINFVFPCNPDNFKYAEIRVSESGNWPNVLAWGSTDASNNWEYETDKWKLLLCDYVDVTCVLVHRHSSCWPLEWETWVSVENDPLIVDFVFGPNSSDCNQALNPQDDGTALTPSSWASIKYSF